MDFEILLEGSMIGAELNALSEAEVVVSKDINKADDFADAIIKGFAEKLNEMSKVIKAIRRGVKENIAAVTSNRDAIVQYLKENDFGGTATTSGSATSIFTTFFGKQISIYDKIHSSFSRAIDVDRALALTVKNDLESIEKMMSKAKKNQMSPAEAYNFLKEYLQSLYEFGKDLDEAIAKAKAKFNPTASGSPIKRWRSELVSAFNKANRSESTFEITRVTSKAKDTVATAISLANKTLKEMTDAINKTGIRTAFDGYNSLALEFNSRMLKHPLGKAAGLKKLPYMNIKAGNIVIPTPKEAEAANKQATSALTKVKEKINGLIEKLKSQINDPSIATVAVSVVVAIATYLVFYGAVKAAGGKVGNPAAVATTFKAAKEVIISATFGKKLLLVALFGIVTAAFVAAGTVGFKFIKAKLTK